MHLWDYLKIKNKAIKYDKLENYKEMDGWKNK